MIPGFEVYQCMPDPENLPLMKKGSGDNALVIINNPFGSLTSGVVVPNYGNLLVFEREEIEMLGVKEEKENVYSHMHTTQTDVEEVLCAFAKQRSVIIEEV